ncbi:MAG: hypothetical protein K1X92_10825 [Bacteroidia bacterium]|nr:hypothetical protein [Bacteroidia bacterium]
MTSEEYRNMLKEQYKKELREKKQFLDKVDQLKKQQTLMNAIENMKPEDDSEDWVNKLNEETAFMEAKTELALTLQEEQKKQLESMEHQVELEKLAAQQLILEMKKQMGLIEDKPEVKPETENTQPEIKNESQTPPPPVLGDF